MPGAPTPGRKGTMPQSIVGSAWLFQSVSGGFLSYSGGTLRLITEAPVSLRSAVENNDFTEPTDGGYTPYTIGFSVILSGIPLRILPVETPNWNFTLSSGEFDIVGWYFFATTLGEVGFAQLFDEPVHIDEDNTSFVLQPRLVARSPAPE